MAVTGTGTEQDPYLVHDYYELKSTINNNNNTNGIYVKLVADIDMKEYDDVQWETIGKDSTHVANLDLNNKTIQNILIATNNSLFQYVNIKNGKIKNVFGNGAIYLGYHAGFNHAMISVNITGFTNRIFESCTITNLTSICMEGIQTSNSCFGNCTMDNVWVLPYIKFGNNNQYLFEYCDVTYCKIASDDVLPRGYLNHTYGLNNATGSFSGCVVDVDVTDMVDSYRGFIKKISENPRSAVNIDALPSNSYSTIPTSSRYSYQGIRDYATLAAQGFNVVEEHGNGGNMDDT